MYRSTAVSRVATQQEGYNTMVTLFGQLLVGRLLNVLATC